MQQIALPRRMAWQVGGDRPQPEMPKAAARGAAQRSTSICMYAQGFEMGRGRVPAMCGGKEASVNNQQPAVDRTDESNRHKDGQIPQQRYFLKQILRDF